jgi:gliding motility-associated-like protein
VAFFPKDLSSQGHQRNAPVCDLIVDAGPDTNVCYPGGMLTLMGSITGNEVFFQWSPPAGLNNPLVLSPIANITGPITYTLTAYAEDPSNPNLIVNGDFSAGNTGFTSDYNYVTDVAGNQEMEPEGTYAVLTNPNNVHWGFSSCNDHSPGTGNMMVVNGAASFQNVWCETIPVSPDSYFNISAWVASVVSSSPAVLQFSINGSPIGAIVNAVPSTCVWVPFNTVWNSGSNTTAEICILNLNTEPLGNDFALDDISMIELCSVTDEVEITLIDEDAPVPVISGPAFACVGDIVTYSASFPPEPLIENYEWIVPPGATVVSGQGTPSITVQWNDEQETFICLAVETRCDEDEGCYDVTVGDIPPYPLISGGSSLCPGESISLYTPEGDNTSFDWTLSSNVNLLEGEGTNEIEIEWAASGEAEICIEVTNACGTNDNCTYITLHPNYSSTFDTTICEGTTFIYNGHIYGNGQWSGTEYFVTQAGCDSIIQVNVSESDALEFHNTNVLCPGDSVLVNNEWVDTAGIYVDTFLTAAGCDSIVMTEIIISAFDTTWLSAMTCDPAEAGITYTTFAQGNCDSTVVEEVIFIPPDTTAFISASCNPSDTGLTTVTLMNVSGCDSIIITEVNLLPSDTTILITSSCNPGDTGTSTIILTNVAGCDSTIIRTTLFSLSDTTYLHSVVCQYSDTAATQQLLQNIKGCDSLVIMTHAYVGSDTTYIHQPSCLAGDTGVVFNSFLNQFGCDSIVSVSTFWVRSDTVYVDDVSCNAGDTGTFILHLTNHQGCDSMIVTHIDLLPVEWCEVEATIDLEQPRCYGDSAVLNVNILIGQSPYTISWYHSGTGMQESQLITSHPANEVYYLPFPGIYYIEIASSNGITLYDTLDIVSISRLSASITSGPTFNSYHVPCHGDQTALLSVMVNDPGTPPYSFEWSDGHQGMFYSNLGAGDYEVIVTDAKGCSVTASFAVTQPPPMAYEVVVSDVTCFGENDGAFSIVNTTGGIPPWAISIDGINFQPQLTYPHLAAGQYNFIIHDQNNCSQIETISIFQPEDWSISLGKDTLVPYGVSVNIQAEIQGMHAGNLSITWSDDECENCYSRTILPSNTISLIVEATDQNGCVSSDAINIQLYVARGIYIPNVFSPNDDGINDLFDIHMASGIDRVEEIAVFDRWGNLIYEAFNIPGAGSISAWDGKHNGQELNPGVYAYKIIVHYVDNKQEVMVGNVTLIR